MAELAELLRALAAAVECGDAAAMADWSQQVQLDLADVMYGGGLNNVDDPPGAEPGRKLGPDELPMTYARVQAFLKPAYRAAQRVANRSTDPEDPETFRNAADALDRYGHSGPSDGPAE